MLEYKFWILPFALLLTSCGGGSSGPGTSIDASDVPKLISWTPPESNTDGSKLTDLLKYRIYYGADARSMQPIPKLYIDAKDSSGNLVNQYDLSLLTSEDLTLITELLKDSATLVFAMTAINGQNIESEFSNFVTYPGS